jgi:chorismate lyase
VWANLSAGRAELFRDILRLQLGHSVQLEKLLGCNGPFWARDYLFVRNGQPLTLIHEVFSNRLDIYLGARHADKQLT